MAASAGITIGSHVIATDEQAFIIAEIGINHNGSFSLAKQLIDESARAGADCAKFQLRDLKTLYRNYGNPDDMREDLGSQYTLDILSRSQLTKEEMFQLFDYCHKVGIVPLCTPWEHRSLERLEEYGMSAYKVASADLTNIDFLEDLCKTGKPLIVSTGMSTEEDVRSAISLLQRHQASYVLLHCNSTYPTPYDDVQLAYMQHLEEIGQCIVGYSSHDLGIEIPIAAVARGAKVIEKHITLDRTMEGNDHRVSLLPDEFAEMVSAIRHVESAIGTPASRVLTRGEYINRHTLSKSVVAAKPIARGTIITEDLLTIKSPGSGLPPGRKQELLGLAAYRDYVIGDLFFEEDIVRRTAADSVQHFTFQRPWGFPVRYHDYKQILASVGTPDLLEFHLSFKDLDCDLQTIFPQPLPLDLVMHSPEMFAHSHQLDLCSDDEDYRMQSIAHLQRVIHIARTLTPFFTKTRRPRIIINVGGFSLEKHTDDDACERLYEQLAKSLKLLDCEGVELLPQTMPPYPWLSGGRQHHIMFVQPKDTAAFCRAHNMRLCLDISHSALSCTVHNLSLSEFLKEVGPFVSHLHISDSFGDDNEGLQIGDGDIDFVALGNDLSAYCPDASFIPEIWQGHLNGASGSLLALKRLDKYL